MRGCTWVACASAIATIAVLSATVHAAPSALDKPAFTATPAELLALAVAAPANDAGLTLLREDMDVRYDERGRATTRRRVVLVIQRQDVVESASYVNGYWRTDYQARPTLRARVIDPSGSVTQLDPSRLTDTPIKRGDSNTAGARWVTSGPVSVLRAGTVIEHEVTVADREPALGLPGALRSFLSNAAPTHSTRITHSAPAARKPRCVQRGLPRTARTHREQIGDRVYCRYEIDALPATLSEAHTPWDAIADPYVGITVAPSWAEVARGYHALFERRLAERPLAWPAELPRAATLATVTAATAWVHRKVNDDGLSLEHASLLPAPPAEVVARGTAAGADKPALLIALLRQAGLRADLALICMWRRPDVDPELPGVGMFDSALVRVRVDGRDLWIDLSSELLRPGQLGTTAQGRRVLVISDTTTALASTPRPVSSDSTVHEVRSFTASEQGGAGVVEVIRATGGIEVLRRSDYHQRDTDQRAEHLAQLVSQKYAGTVESTRAGDPLDLTAPFTTTVAVTSTPRVFASRDQIFVYLHPASALSEVPTELLDDASAGPPRVHDFQWPVPHIYEVEYRVALPTGFTLPELTPDRTRAIGSATFSERRRLEGQTLVVAFRFDTGKPRLTAPEVVALQLALAALKAESITIEIEHTGFALSHAGKSREAIAECQRLIALHPKEALHRSQLALVLLRAAAGQAARRTAREAVALAPTDADPLTVLGYVLRHDSVGRLNRDDWDRAGALAAYRRARTLDPGHFGAALGLAEVLERNLDGLLTVIGPELGAAIEPRRAAFALDDSDDNALALARTLFRSGGVAEAERMLRALPAAEERDQLLVASVAVLRGAGAALDTARDLRRLSESESLRGGAVMALLAVHDYDLARAVDAGIVVRSWPGKPLISALAAHPALPANAATPRGAALDALAAFLDPTRATSVFWDAGVANEFRSAELGVDWEAGVNLGPRGAGDLVQSIAELEVSPAPTPGVARVTVRWKDSPFTLYFVNERGRAKLIGGSLFMTAIGRYAVRANNAASEARARALLDWLRMDLDIAQGALTPAAAAFAQVWARGGRPDRGVIQLAGAMLVDHSDAERAVPVLTRCPSALPGAALACQNQLLAIYAARERGAELLSALDKLDNRDARLGKEYRQRYAARALLWLGRYDQAVRATDALLADDAGDGDALHVRLAAALGRDQHGARGAVVDALRYADPSSQLTGDVLRRALHEAAWFRLVTGQGVPGAREQADRAVDLHQSNAAYLNTRAAIEAELGDTQDAILSTFAAMQRRASTTPTEADWYVIGRVYEQLGLASDAIAAYMRVKTPSRDPLHVFHLAARRHAALARNKPK